MIHISIQTTAKKTAVAIAVVGAVGATNPDAGGDIAAAVLDSAGTGFADDVARTLLVRDAHHLVQGRPHQVQVHQEGLSPGEPVDLDGEVHSEAGGARAPLGAEDGQELPRLPARHGLELLPQLPPHPLEGARHRLGVGEQAPEQTGSAGARHAHALDLRYADNPPAAESGGYRTSAAAKIDDQRAPAVCEPMHPTGYRPHCGHSADDQQEYGEGDDLKKTPAHKRTDRESQQPGCNRRDDEEEE